MSDGRVAIPELIPVMPVKETVVLPLVLTPLIVGQPKSVALVEDVSRTNSLVGFFLQRDAEQSPRDADDIHRVGSIAMLHEVRSASDQTRYAMVQGLDRVRVLGLIRTEPYWLARISAVPETDDGGSSAEALERTCKGLFKEFVGLSAELPDAAAVVVDGLPTRRAVTYFIASAVPMPASTRQALLELDPLTGKLRRLIEMLQHELEVLRLEERIARETRENLVGQQKQAVLRERMKTIQKELGDEGEVAELRARVDSSSLPAEARAEVDRELDRLARIPDGSPEFGMVRTWLDTVLALPWFQRAGTPIDLQRSKAVLDADHHDLEKVKERLIEHLAVKKLRDERGAPPEESAREPILCLVGPPGVGKTSVGKSIARAMNRPFVRVSLGGVHDESEIRGHRRTYIGAMPGRIIQALKRAEASDAVFMLDEVDKMSSGFHGDPAAALLEVLDPAQNQAFVDTYLNVPYDLSNVLFICTANTVEPIPPPLLDRMELIPLAGYTEAEKLQIARRFLLPRQRRASGLSEAELEVEDPVLARVIREYTREAGVRGLERELSALARKVARRIGEGAPPGKVTFETLHEWLGRPRIFDEVAERIDRPGVATALAWTPSGGELLFVEAAIMSAYKSELTLTGMLGSVMKESARAALTWVRSNHRRLGLDAAWFDRKTVHLHVPAGAVPKDGPSAGVAMVLALASMATGVPVKPKVAVTGEVTLRGKVLAVGGVKEKVLAAYRAGIETVVLPRRNEKDLEELPPEVRARLRIELIESAEELLAEAFEHWPLADGHEQMLAS